MRWRTAVEHLGETQALAYAAKAFVTEFGPVLERWRQTGPNILPVRFEDLTGPNSTAVWYAVLTHLGIVVPEQVLSAVLRTYRIEALADPRYRSAKTDKYALRGQRSWDNIARARAHVALLEQLYEWAQAYGYPSDLCPNRTHCFACETMGPVRT